MELDALKQLISDKTGIPKDMLTGETAEENVARAKALLAYKKEQGQDSREPKSTREQFKEWCERTQLDVPQQEDPFHAALAGLEEVERLHVRAYPEVKDGGSASQEFMYDGRSTRDKFEDWLLPRLGTSASDLDVW